jgi:excisionase family DNA binding protein
MKKTGITDTAGAAKAMGVEQVTVRSWIIKGELKAEKIGGVHIIKFEDLASMRRKKRGRPAVKAKKKGSR